MYLNVATDDLYQKIVQKKLFCLRYIRIKTVFHLNKLSLKSAILS